MTTITEIPQSQQTKINDPINTPPSRPEIAEIGKNVIPHLYTEKGLSTTRVGKEIGGIVAGSVGTVALQSTGVTVGLHEALGHGFLGIGLTGDNSSATYQTNGWDRFTQMTHSSSFTSGIENFFRWLFTIDSGQSGVTHYSGSTPNGLGIAMGPEGRDAWISISGSIPGLILDSASVAGGMLLRKKSPILGNLFVMFGLADSVTASSYTIDAATMSTSQMEQAAKTGHDFANFALKMSDITGIPATDIAITTATLWTVIVPLIAIATYVHTKSHMTDIVPDLLALREWIQDEKNEEAINTHWEKHCEESSKKREAVTPNPYNFVNYLLEKIPPSALNPHKINLLASWNKNIPTDRIQTGLNIAGSLGMITSTGAKILNVVSLAHPGLESASVGLSYAAPALVAASIASAAYQVYKDFKCDDSVIPRKAKMISVAKLIVTIVSAVFIILGIFQPFLNPTFPIALFGSAIINIGLTFARAKIVQNQYALHTAKSDAVRGVMHPLWESHQKEKPNQPMNKALERWAKLAQPERIVS